MTLLWLVVTGAASAASLDPANLQYQGAFRTTAWAYLNGNGGVAYYPDGDGGNGSLYGSRNTGVVELTIPTDLKKASDGYVYADLASATALQGPTNPGFSGKGLEYLPASRTGLGAGKLFYGTSSGGSSTGPTHAYCDLDLTNQQGPWELLNVDDRRVGYFISEIPQTWVDANLPAGQILITGSDWAQYGYGVSVYAYNPLDPSPGTSLPTTKLIEYNSTHLMNDWDKDDDWEGSAWLEAGGDSALVLTGSKDANNSALTADTPDFKAWMTFYDPADLAAVAAGSMTTYDIQPYANLDVSGLMFLSQTYFVGTAYDRANNVLYAAEYVGSTQQIVHVWHVVPEPATMGLLLLGGLPLVARRRRR